MYFYIHLSHEEEQYVLKHRERLWTQMALESTLDKCFSFYPALNGENFIHQSLLHKKENHSSKVLSTIHVTKEIKN